MMESGGMCGVTDPPFVVLSDGVICLRCLAVADVPAHLAGEDADQIRWLNEGRPSSAERLPEWVRSNQQEWLTGGPRRHFGVRDAVTDQLIGNVEANLRLEGLAAGEVNISYAVFPAWRGNGVAVRAVRLVCEWLRKDANNHVAVIRVAPGNHFSRRVPVAAGFHEIGPVLADGERLIRYDQLLHSLD